MPLSWTWEPALLMELFLNVSILVESLALKCNPGACLVISRAVPSLGMFPITFTRPVSALAQPRSTPLLSQMVSMRRVLLLAWLPLQSNTLWLSLLLACVFAMRQHATGRSLSIGRIISIFLCRTLALPDSGLALWSLALRMIRRLYCGLGRPCTCAECRCSLASWMRAVHFTVSAATFWSSRSRTLAHGGHRYFAA